MQEDIKLEGYVSHSEHDEFSRRIEAEERRQNERLDSLEEKLEKANDLYVSMGRMEDEDRRQNKRIEILEKTVQQIDELARSIDKMATNMENMTREISRQGECIESAKQEPADKWKHMAQKAMETAVGAVVTALVVGLMIMAAKYVR